MSHDRIWCQVQYAPPDARDNATSMSYLQPTIAGMENKSEDVEGRTNEASCDSYVV
jgi:hypothetical protein